ncbi:glycine/D-amino acid oxidase-like deaminating enzyme [Kitasatospora sp. GP30]|uniref:FAD-dependent oxidoreductase n=1 Tax=Kitasatospora sp. GP30 TaxID=3035084 RepID=UPI000C70A40A|nr:FAD-dependent oxidoreductase [Kitasatospora sp. GP30]MDH6140502.1 glycine/D-amino acid oxidase-like deaminating enzyme [Kitasatospora sp. GP30]
MELRDDRGIAVIGGGLAGAVLAWRLTRMGHPVTVLTGGATVARDATAISGGLVRAFETDPLAATAAALSLAELRADAGLRELAGYREFGSSYLLPPGSTEAAIRPVLDLVGELLPGAAELMDAAELKAFRGLPPGTLAVVEPAAGCLSPARLRAGLLAAVEAVGGTVRAEAVTALAPDGELRTAARGGERFRAVVVAAGPWTPRLLRSWGLPDQGLRAKQIQYTLGGTSQLPPGMGAFVDETSGLYGRPDGPHRMLLGLPTDRWDMDPGALTPLPELAAQVAACAAERLGLADWPGPDARTATAADCWAPPGGLAGLLLRRLLPHGPLFTFTGGTGGAAKTVLANSRDAATMLVEAFPAS